MDRNPLNAVSIDTHIPALESRGVVVSAENLITPQVVDIPDSNLRTTIESALGIAPGGTITAEAMATLTTLEARDGGISNLTGLEYATNLTVLGLDDNNISDISPVSGLTNLTILGLAENNISDISAVAGLTNLTTLGLDSNNISDILAVAGLTNLTTLGLGDNSISDISPVVGFNQPDHSESCRKPFELCIPLHSHPSDTGKRTFVTSFDPRTARQIRIVSGDDQQGQPGEPLEQPFVVEIQDQNGAAFEGVPVTFTIASGGGTLSVTSVTTDANGKAESTLTLGANPGANTVTVSVAGIQKGMTFTAEGIGLPKTLEIVSGDDQQGRPGETLANPFVVVVRDQSDKPLPGVEVTFSVTGGDGTLNATRATTDTNGRAESTLTLGSTPGTNTVRVSVEGNTQAVAILNIETASPMFTLSIPAGTHAIHIPLDVRQINGEDGEINTVGHLYDALGDAVNFIISLDANGNWISYLDDSSKGFPQPMLAIGDDTGLIAVMKSAASIELMGDALGTGGVSQVSIATGNNLVGLPLDPTKETMISDLLVEGVGAIAVSKAAGDGFHTITAAGDTGDGFCYGRRRIHRCRHRGSEYPGCRFRMGERSSRGSTLQWRSAVRRHRYCMLMAALWTSLTCWHGVPNCASL